MRRPFRPDRSSILHTLHVSAWLSGMSQTRIRGKKVVLVNEPRCVESWLHLWSPYLNHIKVSSWLKWLSFWVIFRLLVVEYGYLGPSPGHTLTDSATMMVIIAMIAKHLREVDMNGCWTKVNNTYLPGQTWIQQSGPRAFNSLQDFCKIKI